MKNIQATKEQLINLLNIQLKSHKDYQEGMSFDDIIPITADNYEVKANFNFNNKSVSENYVSSNHIYDEVFNAFLK